MNQRQLRQLLTLLVVLLVAVVGYFQSRQGMGGGGNACQDEFRSGAPTTAVQGTLLLCRDEYVSVYDTGRRLPLAVGEHLRPQEFDGSEARTDNFQPDPTLSAADRAELNDYRGSGFDRGHMAPAADFSSSVAAMDQSFYLSNMVPQNSAMNRGIWAGLESATRACARSENGVYVLTGPVFPDASSAAGRRIGPDGLPVPSALYKVVVSGSSARAFLLLNRDLPRTSSYLRYETTVDEVQRATGLTLFPAGGVNTQQRGSFCGGAYGS